MRKVTLPGYLESVSRAISSKDGATLASNLKKGPNSVTAKLEDELRVPYCPDCSELTRAQQNRNLDNVFIAQQNTVDPEWRNVVSGHLQAYVDEREGKTDAALEAQKRCVDNFQKVFRRESNWVLPVLYAILKDLKSLSSKADATLRKHGGKVEHLEAAVRDTFMPLIRLCINDRSNNATQSKVMAALRIVNYCFASYFELNTISLCRNLIVTIESASTPAISQYPISQQVTYFYYRGKLTLFGGEYKLAAEYLKDAFNMCKKTSIKNKRLLLLYLIPVEMLLDKLLRKYSLTQLHDIVVALKSGNIKNFRLALYKYEDLFITRGLYMLMEKLQMLCYRNFFNAVARIVQEKSKNKLLLDNQVLPLLHWMGEKDVDIDEIECIAANLIFNGYIKGYISHKHRCVVLSNKDPFPSIASLRIL